MNETMTKEIIREMVRNEFTELRTDTEIFGSSDDITRMRRARWAALDKLWRTLYSGEDYLK